MKQKFTSIVVALLFGLAAALYAYDWVTDPAPRLQREQEERVVVSVRDILKRYVAPGTDIELVDPVDPDRKVGKVYISPVDGGWEISGYYRREATDPWHPWLMSVNSELQLQSLSVQDSNPEVIEQASAEPKFDAAP